MGLSLLETLASQPQWVLLCSSAATFTVLRFSFFLLQWLYTYSVRPAKNLLDYGRWAVLARRGLNLVLVGRNPQQLSQVAAAIKAEVRTADLRTAVVDLAGDLRKGIGRLESVIRDTDVGILVNNAGIINVRPLYLHEMDDEMLGSILRAVLPGRYISKIMQIIYLEQILYKQYQNYKQRTSPPLHPRPRPLSRPHSFPFLFLTHRYTLKNNFESLSCLKFKELFVDLYYKRDVILVLIHML
ncbi:unnamed protein product [Spirodela intermedia]|uniref:Uncharacterized protein n=1 Tax=Spirodela intermedia TaxID=51605 RepID=A0A7I8JDU7_SPIIN|nr:unnamed protein product [Spirodela intermedia]CAA6668324.1 unnamed protein product [Spirodela intermedia]